MMCCPALANLFETLQRASGRRLFSTRSHGGPKRSSPKGAGMRVKHMKRILPVAAVLAASHFTAQAATTTIDFNSDPTGTGLYEEPGGAAAAEWRPSGGASGGANDGYLSITDARDSQRAVLIFKDLEDGLVVKSFTFECDLRMGGGNSDPADGFSLNYAAASDPVITGGNFAGTDGEGNLPEEGTQTGLAIGFDTWQSGTIGSAQDVVGVSLRVGGQLIAQLPVPLAGTNIYLPTEPLPGQQTPAQYVYTPAPYANLATNDPNYRFSMQTGARNTTDDLNGNGIPGEPEDQPGTDTAQQPFWGDPMWDLWVKHLKWEKFKAQVDDQGRVKIWWKGFEVTPEGGIDTDFTPQAGRLVFGARTGGNNQVHHVDNIVLTTQPYTSVVPGSVRGNAAGFHFYVADAGAATVANGGVTLKVNGQDVTPTVVKSGNNTVISYKPAALWPVGTVVTLAGSVRDNFGTSTTFERNFTVGNYATIPAEFAVPANVVSDVAVERGLFAKLHQIAGSRAPAITDGNTTPNAEKQLRGVILDPATGQPYANMIPAGPAQGGAYKMDYINWNQNAIDGEEGSFRSTYDAPHNVPDQPIPGIDAGPDQGDPTLPAYNNNIAGEVVAYLDLPAGYHYFAVNSDDGFRVSTARNPEDVLGVTLGEDSRGRGQGDTFFDVYVPVAGIYPVRLVWWEGGGGAETEFFTLDPVSQTKVLVNDANNPLAIKAYTTRTAALRPGVTSVAPDRNSRLVNAASDIVITLADGTLPVNDASIKLTVNGAAVSPTIANNGAITTVTRPGGLANLLPAGNNNVALVYSYTEGGSTVNVTNSYSFNVVAYKAIPAANKVPLSSVNASSDGFTVRVGQIDRTGNGDQGAGGRFPGDGNMMPRPEAQLADALIDPATLQPYPNLAAGDFDGDYIFDVSGGINFNGTGGSSGVVPDDLGNPGLPGAGSSQGGIDNYVAEYLGYLDLKAGSYLWAVNSDDGFVVSSAPNPRDTLGTVLGFYNGGRGNANPIAENSVFGVVVPEDGIYPVRVLYWQGGGGVNVEFVSIEPGTGRAVLIGNSGDPKSIKSYSSYTGPARAWAQWSVSPTPWDNRTQQAGPGPILVYGDGGRANADQGDRRPFADTGIGAVFANGAGKTFRLLLNGAEVTPVVTTSGTNTTVVYTPAQPLPSGSTNTAGLVYEGSTNYWTWSVQNYTNVPAGLSRPASAAVSTARGFRAKVVKARNDAGLAATTDRAELQLAGTLVDPKTGQPYENKAAPGPEADGSYIVQTINWNQEVRGGNNSETGNFRTDSLPGTPDLADQPIPGVGLGTTGEAAGANDSIVAEITAWLELPAGYVKLGVNSDDGFKVSIAEAGNAGGVLLQNVSAGKGSSDVPFSFTVPEAGLYPVRLVWYEGGGGANVEFYSYGPNNQKIPINADLPGAIKAYYQVTGGDNSQPKITVTRAGNGDLNITWTNGGTLEASPAVAGPAANWQAVDSDGTYTAQPTGSARFFRVRK